MYRTITVCGELVKLIVVYCCGDKAGHSLSRASPTVRLLISSN